MQTDAIHTAGELTLHDATSAALKSVFRTVAETAAEGESKYSPRTCRDLAKAIVCRTYAPAILELCHLINIADACGAGRDRYERFFWASGPAHPRNFRAYVDAAIGAGGWRRAGFERVANGVRIGYVDGDFTVAFSRMPFLSALAEFLLTSLGYEPVDTVFAAMIAEGPSRGAISERANELSRMVYDYLRDHLPSAQYQRKFHQLVAFVSGRLGEHFDPADIDDETVLRFWQEMSLLPESVDFRTYRSVFRSFVRLVQSLERAREIVAVEDPAILGTDRDAGEFDPATIRAAIDGIEAPQDSLLALEEVALDRVKLLNKKEFEDLSAVSECGRTLTRLLRSFLRSDVFGRAQRRITQALRGKLDASSITGRIRDSATEDYEDRISRYGSMLDQLDRVLLASLYCLVRLRSPEAISLMLRLRPDLDLSGVAVTLRVGSEANENVETLSAPSVADHFIRLLEDPKHAGPDLASLIGAAHKSYRGLSRQGFRDEDVDDPDVAAAIEAGADHLFTVREELQRLVRRFEHPSCPNGGWRAAFAADRDIFIEQFLAIYGGTS